MKKIEAVMKPFKLDGVKDALAEIGIQGMTVGEVKCFGREKAHRETFRGSEYAVDFLPEIKIELILSDDRLNAAVAAIVKGTKTGKTGNDQVFVSHIEDALQPNSERMLEHAL
jgi:nitrogen regulatory protein P-II 1